MLQMFSTGSQTGSRPMFTGISVFRNTFASRVCIRQTYAKHVRNPCMFSPCRTRNRGEVQKTSKGYSILARASMHFFRASGQPAIPYLAELSKDENRPSEDSPARHFMRTI